MVDIFKQLKKITFKVIAHDGTLFPTRAKYKGCTYSSKTLMVKSGIDSEYGLLEQRIEFDLAGRHNP